MIGWRARLGIILPAVNTTTEPEFYKVLPKGITAHFTRMEFLETTPKFFERMVEDIPESVRKLSYAKVHAIAFACTSGSLYGGQGYDQTIIARIKEHYNVPATTTSTAVIEAFKIMGVKRVAVATPYESWVDEKERHFFEANGFQVVNIGGMGLRGFDVCEVQPETFYGFAKAQDRKEADCLFMSCMGLRTLEIINRLEEDLTKPVLSSNQATLWMLLKLTGIPAKEIATRFGSLFLKC